MDPATNNDQEPEQSNWQYVGSAQQAEAGSPQVDALSWSAPEYVAHDKPASWYAMFFAGSVLVIGLIFLLTRDIITAISLLLIVAIFAFGAARKPRLMEYSLDEHGLRIGAKYYSYTLFKSFSVAQDGVANTVLLLPMKRFMPLVSLGYPAEMEREITEILGTYLPYEQHRPDAVERLMSRVHF